MFSGTGDLQKRRHRLKDENKEEEKTEFLSHLLLSCLSQPTDSKD